MKETVIQIVNGGVETMTKSLVRGLELLKSEDEPRSSKLKHY